MSEISVRKANVMITEQTIKELTGAVAKAKEQGFEEIIITSEFSGVQFIVYMETKPHTQESLGYRLTRGIKSEEKSQSKDDVEVEEKGAEQGVGQLDADEKYVK